MAVKASAHITLSYMVDVKATYRYYLLQSATLSTPSKPADDVYPPATGSWDDTEPSYTEGSTNALYFVDCTVFNNDKCVYSEVSKSSSYEAAKAAYIKAANAQGTAEAAQNTASNLQADFDSKEVSTFSALSIDGGKTLASYDLANYLESGTLTNGAEATSSTNVRINGYIKVMGGETYVWDVKNASDTAITPTTFFYSLAVDSSSGAETYTYLSSQSATNITVPTGDEIYLRCTMTEIRSDETDTICTLTLNGIDGMLNDDSVAIHIGLYSTLNGYASVDPDNYEWKMADSTIMANSQILFDALNNKLYDETNGDIKKLTGAVEEAQNTADEANERIDARNKHIEIIDEESTIRLLADGNSVSPSSEVKLTSDKISFMRDGVEGAYIGYPDAEQSDRTAMATSKTYVTEIFPRVEDPDNTNKWIGTLCWVARSNGHLSLKVVK